MEIGQKLFHDQLIAYFIPALQQLFRKHIFIGGLTPFLFVKSNGSMRIFVAQK